MYMGIAGGWWLLHGLFATARALEVVGAITGCSGMGFEVFRLQWATRAFRTRLFSDSGRTMKNKGGRHCIDTTHL